MSVNFNGNDLPLIDEIKALVNAAELKSLDVARDMKFVLNMISDIEIETIWAVAQLLSEKKRIKTKAQVLSFIKNRFQIHQKKISKKYEKSKEPMHRLFLRMSARIIEVLELKIAHSSRHLKEVKNTPGTKEIVEASVKESANEYLQHLIAARDVVVHLGVILPSEWCEAEPFNGVGDYSLHREYSRQNPDPESGCSPVMATKKPIASANMGVDHG